jgi:Protein of unknown function (DUF2690)
MRKKILAAIVLGVATPVSFLGSAPLANAATALSTCSGATCTGKPAASYTCVNDAEVIYSVNIMNGSTVVGNIQLKYSPSCRATWARVISDLGFGSGAKIISSNSSLGFEGCNGIGGAGTGCNTDMMDDENLTSHAMGTVFLTAGESGSNASASTASF